MAIKVKDCKRWYAGLSSFPPSAPWSRVSSVMRSRLESPFGDEVEDNTFAYGQKTDEAELLRSPSISPLNWRESPTFVQSFSEIFNADDEDSSRSSSPSSRKRHHGSLDSTMSQWIKNKRRRASDEPDRNLPTEAKQVLAAFFTENLLGWKKNKFETGKFPSNKIS